MGTTEELFGPQNDEDAPRYTEDEIQTLYGDIENLPEGEHFKDPTADLLFKKEFLRDPDTFLGKVDARIEALSNADFVSEEDWHNRQNSIQLLEEMKEVFPQRLEGLKAYRANYQAAYDQALAHLRETGDPLPLMEVKGVIPPRPKPSPEEVAYQNKLKSAMEKAKQTGDWSHVFRLKGI